MDNERSDDDVLVPEEANCTKLVESQTRGGQLGSDLLMTRLGGGGNGAVLPV